MQRWTFWLASLFAASLALADPLVRFGSPEPLPKSPGSIRLATYNLENLFDDQDDPALAGQYEDLTSIKPADHLAGLAAAIRTLDADVLAVEEVESEAVLRWFRDTYLQDLGYTHLASLDAGDPRGIEQGVLSRYPIKSVQNWPNRELPGTQPAKEGDRPNPLAGRPLTFHRSPLRVEIEIPSFPASSSPASSSPASSSPAPSPSSPAPAGEVPESSRAAGTPITGDINASPSSPAPAGEEPRPRDSGGSYTLTLYVIHQKSGRYSAYWRNAEAAGLADLIAQSHRDSPNANIAILGDFNSTPAEPPAQTLLAAGLIDLFADLRNPDPSAPPDPRFITHESGRSIDLILINANLAPEIISVSRFVLGTPARPAGMDYRTAPIPPGYGSDHYPVSVDIRPIDN